MILVSCTLELEFRKGLFFQIGSSWVGVQQFVQVQIVRMKNISQTPLCQARYQLRIDVSRICSRSVQFGFDMQCAQKAMNLEQEIFRRCFEVVVARNVYLVAFEKFEPSFQ